MINLKYHKKDKLVFVYSGQASQWYGMGQNLYNSNPLFKQVITEIDEVLTSIDYFKSTDSSLISEMLKTKDTSRSFLAKNSLPILFAVQVALTKVLENLGITPDAIVGHSNGDVTAAYISKSLTLKEIADLMLAREKALEPLENSSSLIALNVSEEIIRKEILDSGYKVDVATVNSPSRVTVSGDIDEINDFYNICLDKGFTNDLLKVYFPIHSYKIDEIKDKFYEIFPELTPSEPNIPFYSSTLKSLVTKEQITKDFWYSSLRNTIYFYPTILKTFNDGYTNFLEVSPHSQLVPFISEIMLNHGYKGNAVKTLEMYKDEGICLTTCLENLEKLEIIKK